MVLIAQDWWKAAIALVRDVGHGSDRSRWFGEETRFSYRSISVRTRSYRIVNSPRRTSAKRSEWKVADQSKPISMPSVERPRQFARAASTKRLVQNLYNAGLQQSIEAYRRQLATLGYA